MSVARKTVEKHVLHWHQLNEQQKKKKATSEEIASILDCYVKRWQRWAVAGLQGIKIDVCEQSQNQLALSRKELTLMVQVPVLLQDWQKESRY